MKLYTFLYGLAICTPIFAEHLNEQNNAVQDSNSTCITDTQDPIPSTTLSQEDLSFLIFDETDLATHNLQEDETDETIITQEELNFLNAPKAVASISENQTPKEENKTILEKNPEELFSTSIQDFIFTHKIVSQETFSSCKKAKLQGKLLAQQMQDLAQAFSITLAQARNITHNYIQKKCQDLNLGISSIEKKSFKVLMKQL